MTHRVLAVDLGATSIRVAVVDLDMPRPSVEVIYRWKHSPISDPQGSLRWDWDGIVEHVERGLVLGLESGPIASIGVDGWGVDYGLIGQDGELVDQPFAYRDNRTANWKATAAELGVERLYGRTGVQLMGINTVFQLATEAPTRLEQAHRMMLLPDLLVHHLTGWIGAERSNVSTTGLMDVRTGSWSNDLIAEIGVPRSLFPEPTAAGMVVGDWHGTPVHLVGSHDTASAFLGMPSTGVDTVFVSTGSWVIVGVERPQADTSPQALAANFSNEAGALGGVRFLKNVVGFWILEQCRASWGDSTIESLIAEAFQIDFQVPTFDASDARFVGPDDMLAEVQDAGGLPPGTARPVVVRSIIDSIVDGVIKVVHEIESATDHVAARLALVGGGSRVPLLPELMAARSGLDVIVGSAEATALGNAIVQGIAVGRFADLGHARDWLSTNGMAT